MYCYFAAKIRKVWLSYEGLECFVGFKRFVSLQGFTSCRDAMHRVLPDKTIKKIMKNKQLKISQTHVETQYFASCQT